MLYSSENCIVKLKLFFADKRIFSIDNGGPRGVISLKILKVIQDIIELDTRFQDLFDIVFDINIGKFASKPFIIEINYRIGGFIVYILFLRGISVAQYT